MYTNVCVYGVYSHLERGNVGQPTKTAPTRSLKIFLILLLLYYYLFYFATQRQKRPWHFDTAEFS